MSKGTLDIADEVSGRIELGEKLYTPLPFGAVRELRRRGFSVVEVGNDLEDNGVFVIG